MNVDPSLNEEAEEETEGASSRPPPAPRGPPLDAGVLKQQLTGWCSAFRRWRHPSHKDSLLSALAEGSARVIWPPIRRPSQTPSPGWKPP